MQTGEGKWVDDDGWESKSKLMIPLKLRAKKTTTSE